LNQSRPFADPKAEEMIAALEANCKKHGIRLYSLDSGRQGIVHVIGPELGLTQPGMTIACGDSHTSTHGAFGAIAFGIGTSQVRDILVSQCLVMKKPKVRKINVTGMLNNGVYAKDIILSVISRLGVGGGEGFAYEYAGEAIRSLGMEARMSLCNMSVEGGARCGYVSPDETTFEYIKGREFAPKGEDFEKARAFWTSIASKKDSHFDDVFEMDATRLEPMVTWGTNPGQAVGISMQIPDPAALPKEQQESARKALQYMSFEPGQRIEGTRIDAAFIGSCTEGRLSDLREAAKILRGGKVAKNVRAIAVPGSQSVKLRAEAEGIHIVFKEAGFEWRDAGCSMCLGMNPDKLVGREICASSSNRNFEGRQGSPTGRTLLMSAPMVAAAALEGRVVNVRNRVRS
jgi:3-isopropylmalate/(R)-2-methylmalate dehydratase large subunit